MVMQANTCPIRRDTDVTKSKLLSDNDKKQRLSLQIVI